MILLLVSLCVGLIAGAPASLNGTSETTIVPVTVAPSYCGDYTLFNNVCVQVKTELATFNEAEVACVIEGGHLMSIHNIDDKDRLLKLVGDSLPEAQSVLLGLQTDDSYYSYTDGSVDDYYNWAKYFPDVYFGNAVQMLLKDGELGGAGQWTNVEHNTTMNYVCVRPNVAPARACPVMQMFRNYGKFSSAGYPVTVISDAKCTYIMAAPRGQVIEMRFPVFETDNGSTVKLYDGLSAQIPMQILNGNMTTNVSMSTSKKYSSTGNIMRLVHTSVKYPSGKGWMVYFTSKNP